MNDPLLTLTRAELKQLTGFMQAPKIASWLTSHGWVFELPGGRGAFPKVDRAYYLARMAGQGAAPKKSRLRLDRM